MNRFMNELLNLWWFEVLTELQDPLSERSIAGLRRILREEYEFDEDVVEYVIEAMTSTPTNFDVDSYPSGIDVDEDDTFVSAHLDDDYDLDEADDEEEDDKKEPAEDGGDDEEPEEDDKAAAERDIQKNSLTGYEKDKLKEDTWVKNKKSGSVYQVKNFNPDTQDPATDDDIAKAKQEKGDGGADSDEPTPKSDVQDNGYSGPKDKSLDKVDSLSSDEFNRPLTPNDEEFSKRNAKFANPIPPEPYKLPESVLNNPKFPKKYLTALERMMNTKPTGDGTKWSHYSDIPGGAGRISAQAGELITMMGTSMSDDDFNKFSDSLLEHEAALVASNPKLKSEASRIITKSWIKSAQNNRTAILNNLNDEFPGSEVMVTAWDTKDDVESLGLSDYENNKGFSTDMYVKVKTKDGKEILKEVSLKKSTEVNFMNSGAGKFADWDPDLPDSINQSVYVSNQRQSLVNTADKLRDDIDSLLKSNSPEADSLKKLFTSKKIDFTKALDDTKNGKGSRAKSKVILSTIKALADSGNDIAQEHLDEVQVAHKKFQSEAIRAITENSRMKEGMLNEIRSEFPLKAVSDGEETMAIGENSFDKKVMRQIFGTDNFDDIKEKLEARPGPPPFLGYRADVDGKIIPLAEIQIREDGVGYGGQMKFDMRLDKRFAKVLKQANEAAYRK